jgi:hypothetical protein
MTGNLLLAVPAGADGRKLMGNFHIAEAEAAAAAGGADPHNPGEFTYLAVCLQCPRPNLCILG